MSGARCIYGAPRLPRAFLPRPRLLDRIGGVPLTIVSGPPGSGKSALLADWASPRAGEEVAGIWVVAEEPLTSTQMLWRTALDMMSQAGLVTEEQILGQSIAVEQTKDLASFLRRGFAQVRRPVTMVVDDAQNLDASARRSVCEMAASTAPLFVIVATRSGSDFTEAIGNTGVDAEFVRDVAFSAAETEAYVDLVGAGSAEEVFAASEGLPLVVRALTFASGRAGKTDDSLARIRSPATAANDGRSAATPRMVPLLPRLSGVYLDPDFYEALLRCSVADVLTIRLAEQLSGSSRAAEWLELAEDQGLGMWRETTQATFTLTTLVRARLRDELQRRDPELAMQLRRIVAEWSLANNREFSAFSIAVQLADLDLASAVLRQVGPGMIITHGRTITELLDPIPLTTLSRHPLLAMALGLCHTARRDRRLRGIELLGVAAIAARRSRATTPADRALVRTLESAALRVIGVGDAGARAARAGAELLDAMTISERESLGALRPVMHAHNGLSMYYAGRVEDAISQFEHSYIAGRPGALGLHGLALLAGAHALAGEMPEAQSWMQLGAESNWPDGMLEDYDGCWFRIAQALDALERFDIDVAQEAVLHVWPIIDTVEHWPLLGYTQAMIDVAIGRPAVGLERLAKLRKERGKRVSLNSQMTLLLDVMTSVLHLALGDRGAAERSVAGRRHGANARSLTARARIALAAGDLDTTFADLGRAAVAGFPSSRIRAEHSAIELAALLRRGQQAEISTAANRTLAVLSARQLRTPLMLLPGADQEAVLALIDALPGQSGLVPPVPPMVLGAVPMAPSLSRREQVILVALVGTASTAQIAEELHVSPNTVKSQLRSLYRKLDVNNRSDAIAVATSYGLISG